MAGTRYPVPGDAPDGEVALPQLLEKRPDILLTDIKMPFMDGLELARIVRKELPDTRIIILSGHNEFEYARKAITLGVNDYLLKPVSSRDILEAVDRSKAQILECRARRIERQSHSITQRELFFSNLYSGILMGPAQMLQRAAQLGISLAAGAYQIILTELDGVIPDREALRDKLYAAPMAYGSGFDGERATFLLLAEDAAGLPKIAGVLCMAGGAGRAGGTERASAAWKTGGPAQRPAESIPSADDSEKAAGVRRQQDAVPLHLLPAGHPAGLFADWEAVCTSVILGPLPADHRVRVFLLCLSLLSLYRAFLCGP
ncbi:MAG: response regulator [Dysosmobacter welbionis]